MNPCIPDWNFDPNRELVELLWQNGQVVMQSQTHRRPSLNQLESQQLPQQSETHYHQQTPVQGAGAAGNTNGSYANSSTLIQDDETVSWIHYPIEDSFEKEFCSPFFTELPSPDPLKTVPEQISRKHSFRPDSMRELNQMLPPRVQFPDSALQQTHGPTKAVNPSQFLGSAKGDPRQSSPHFGGAGDVRECSGMTVGSSHCGSNQIIRNEADFSWASSNGTGTMGLCSQLFTEDSIPRMVPQDKGGKTDTIEPTATSSSGGSGSSFGGTHKNSAGTSSLKRKAGDTEDSECQSKAAKLESGSEKRPSQPSGSTRRSRAAEVHNLSERRRRDRINKKLRALQELIPHCNKTDKASMLDEAIEYLKSLQLQLQVMCMGGGMAAPMMFPGMQPYVSPMGIGVGAHPLAINNVHLPRVPVFDHQSTSAAPPNQTVMCQAAALDPVNFLHQMQNQSLPEQFARFMGIHQLQVAASQPMNMFRFVPQTLQNPLVSAAPGSSTVQLGGGISAGDASSGDAS